MNRGRSRSPIRREGREDRRGRGGGPPSGGGDRTGRFDPDSDRLVFVQNLPFEMSWFQLKDVIREKGGEVSFAELLKTADGRPKGSAVVQLVNRDAVGKCIEALHQQNIGGRMVSAQKIRDPAAFFRNIKTETGIDYLSHRSERNGRPRERRASPIFAQPVNTYGLSTSFLDSLGLRPPLVARVFVTNISYQCGVGKLFDVFRMAGHIEGFDLQLDADGKTKGMAVITYSHPIEAVQAISMLHGQRLLDRTLTVKMDRFEKEDDRDRNGIPNGLRGVGTGLGENGSPLQDLSLIFQQQQQQQQQQAPIYAPPVQPVIQAAPIIAAYQPAPSNPPPQPIPYDPPQYVPSAAAPSAYNPPPARQLSPPPVNGSTYYGQPSSGYTQEQTAYKPPRVEYNGAGGDPYGQARQDPYAPNGSRMSAAAGYGQSSVNGASGGARGSSNYSAPAFDHPTRVLLIKNLPFDYTAQVVASKLQQFGEFESVELLNPGIAKVRFLHVQDAEMARSSLNNNRVDGSVIAVEYTM